MFCSIKSILKDFFKGTLKNVITFQNMQEKMGNRIKPWEIHRIFDVTESIYLPPGNYLNS